MSATLWNGLVARYCPSLDTDGNGTTTLHNLDGNGAEVGSNDGTLTDMDAATDWVVSDGKLALDLDGVNDRIDLYDLPLLANMTLSCWVKTRTYSGAKDLWTKRHSTGTTTLNSSEFLVAFNETDGFGIGYWSSDGTYSGFTASSFPTSPLNTWTHLGLTLSPSNVVIYINGVGETFSTPFATRADGNSQLQFGAANGGTSTRFFDGLVDDMCVFNVAKSATDIAILSGQRGIKVTVPRINRGLINATR